MIMQYLFGKYTPTLPKNGRNSFKTSGIYPKTLNKRPVSWYNSTMETIVGDKRYLAEAARLIREGELVAFPTETVYGLGADAFNQRAVERIFVCKGRPQDNPLIVHLSDFAALPSVVKTVPPLARVLYDRFCPGPLTMIMPKGDALPSVVTAGLGTVGIRFPSHPIARELIALSRPIAAPSANVSKHVSPTTAMHVYDDLAGKIPLILDGGTCAVGIESTIVDLTQEVPTILRPGAVTKEMLAEVTLVATHSGEVKVALAPGMKYMHYSPRCDCTMCAPSAIAEVYRDALQKGVRAVVLAQQSTLDNLPFPVQSRSLGDSPTMIMHELYAALREAETQYQLIILEQFEETGVLYSVMNRAKKSVNVR